MNRDSYTSEARNKVACLPGLPLADDMLAQAASVPWLSQPSCFGRPSHQKELSIQVAGPPEPWPLDSPLYIAFYRDSHTLSQGCTSDFITIVPLFRVSC